MRKTKEVKIATEGSRDKGKTFVITEMSAYDGEMWAIRAMRIAQKSGADIPGGIQAGMAGIAAVGVLAVLEGSTNFDEVKPLLDDMMRCVEIVTDKQTGFRRTINDAGSGEEAVNDDIEEIGTRFLLRREWLNLHMDFSIADALSKLISTTPSASS